MVSLLLFILSFINLSQGQSCEANGTVRLQDGPNKFEGRVEVCMRGEWRTVCNDFWGHNEALVVCRQLGFSTSGTASFIDLRMTGGPLTGIDDTNCTGSEERLVNCRFSLETSDCSSDSHKVGLRCHEERKPENLMLSIIMDETALILGWDKPEAGLTNEQVNRYDVECFFMQSDAAYSLKHSVSGDTTEAFLPASNALSDAASHNCCVKAVFETYSSKACATLPMTSQTGGNTDARQIQGTGCPPDTIVQTVAGVLTTIIVILLVLLLAVSASLVYTWMKMKKIKELHNPSVASDSRKAGSLSNSTSAEQEVNDSISRAKPPNSTALCKESSFGTYSSIGPEYEPVHRAQQVEGGSQSNDEIHTTANHAYVPDSEAIFQPAAYEVPVN